MNLLQRHSLTHRDTLDIKCNYGTPWRIARNAYTYSRCSQRVSAVARTLLRIYDVHSSYNLVATQVNYTLRYCCNIDITKKNHDFRKNDRKSWFITILQEYHIKMKNWYDKMKILYKNVIIFSSSSTNSPLKPKSILNSFDDKFTSRSRLVYLFIITSSLLKKFQQEQRLFFHLQNHNLKRYIINDKKMKRS